MHKAIEIRPNEGIRGCGVRDRAGRMYLTFDGPAQTCGKMPVPLTVCPCCGAGFPFSRTPIWIENPEKLWENLSCVNEHCKACPLNNAFETGPALLIWVGEQYYKTAGDFMRESRYMGISRFIQHIPRRFVLGETWVLLAHKKAQDIGGIFDKTPHWVGGIFGVFRPQKIEIMVDGSESDEVIEGYLKRGLTPVLINKPALNDLHLQSSFLDEDSE